MKHVLLAGTVLLMIAGQTYAQQPPAPPPPAGTAEADKRPDTPPPPPPKPRGPEEDEPHGRMPPPPPPPKGAHFHIEEGEVKVDVKCADDEPMKACADILMQIIDRLDQ
ncbi:hypothetical protein [Agrobacterium arsenijevicii]|uniref:Uncharacterized protein n=1 Tax=Agrobacterium arsenijevicii TaxID=1585697 RepID=A0ABR5DAX9_9HYPH|nr:hypothetical protein RP75_07980 [Agrobacterium arsenijevicii]